MNQITDNPREDRWPLPHLLLILGLWLILFAAALSGPPLLDDADATHAQAAQAMLSSGDFVTLHVDGIRYLEKPPLPYWITALSLRIFAPQPTHSLSFDRAAAFAVHLPQALTVLALALLGYAWSRRAFPGSRFGTHAPLYTAIFTLTSSGVFLFTRIFIPDALLSLLLATSLYALLRSLDTARPSDTAQPFPKQQDAPASQAIWPYIFWISAALAVLAKGLVALVFLFGTTIVFLFWSGQLRQWRRLRPASGTLLLLAVAAPWHILAGLRNTGGSGGHGFFWFYFINEHVLRFLGRRIPRDYNKLPALLYWSLHVVWLFPWSLFAPAALIFAWRHRGSLTFATPSPTSGVRLNQHKAADRSSANKPPSFTRQTILILAIFSVFVLVFFSISTNQEYYTFPVYLPVLILLAGALSAMETAPEDGGLRNALSFSFAALTVIGVMIAAALACGLWSARHLPFTPDIGDLLAHRDVGGYTLSMSHFFDLTGPSFAALRLPASIALIAFVCGPPVAWILHTRRRALPAMIAVAYTSTAFLVAAHLALERFSPMLSSASFARTIQTLERSGKISPVNEVLLFGDQAFGSSIPFYLNRQVLLVDGRSTSMLFGSSFPDAPPVFLTSAQLLAQWGNGPRKLLFVPLEERSTVDRLLGARQIILQQTSGKALITDRPLRPSITSSKASTTL